LPDLETRVACPAQVESRGLQAGCRLPEKLYQMVENGARGILTNFDSAQYVRKLLKNCRRATKVLGDRRSVGEHACHGVACRQADKAL
jgi:hypothetical protein